MQEPDLAGNVTEGEVRQFILEGLASEYPPGEFMGYLNFVADSGFSIGGRDTSDTSGAPIQGGMAWGLLGIEALAAGIVSAATARNQLKLKPKPVSGVSTTYAPPSPTMADPTTFSAPTDNDPST